VWLCGHILLTEGLGYSELCCLLPQNKFFALRHLPLLLWCYLFSHRQWGIFFGLEVGSLQWQAPDLQHPTSLLQSLPHPLPAHRRHLLPFWACGVGHFLTRPYHFPNLPIPPSPLLPPTSIPLPNLCHSTLPSLPALHTHPYVRCLRTGGIRILVATGLLGGLCNVPAPASALWANMDGADQLPAYRTLLRWARCLQKKTRW